MGQQLEALPTSARRSGDGERAWLSKLIGAMEEVARAEVRKLPCDRLLLAAVSAQLSRPAAAFTHHGSRFSLRN